MKKPSRLSPLTKTFCVGGALLGGVAIAHADDADMQALKDRVAQLEGIAAREGILPSGVPAPKFVSAMSDISISGFVSASYFYDTSTPADGSPNAYLWNRTSDSFSINKVKLTIASKPVEASGSDWDAAFRASLIWGEDAPIVNTGGARQGMEALREAYVEANIPIGTGLNLRAGQLISLLNYESGDGGSANPNFSQGNQWFYTGNGPSAGVQLGYDFSEKVNLKVRVQNGLYAGPIDNNRSKTFMGALGLKPCSKSWVSLIGFAGNENSTFSVYGGSVLAGYQFTPKFGSGYEFDYFVFDLHGGGDDTLWSLGGWFTFDFSPKAGVAIRGEYLHDKNGFGFGPGSFLGFPANGGGDIYGVTLTLNYKPLPNLKIQPEIRFDGTGVNGGFDGQDTRVILGAGISYLF